MWKSDLIGLDVNVNGARFRYELFYIVSRETSHDKNDSRFSTEFKTEIPWEFDSMTSVFTWLLTLSGDESRRKTLEIDGTAKCMRRRNEKNYFTR